MNSEIENVIYNSKICIDNLIREMLLDNGIDIKGINNVSDLKNILNKHNATLEAKKYELNMLDRFTEYILKINGIEVDKRTFRISGIILELAV